MFEVDVKNMTEGRRREGGKAVVIKHNRLIQITRRISDKRNIVVSLKVQ